MAALFIVDVIKMAGTIQLFAAVSFNDRRHRSGGWAGSTILNVPGDLNVPGTK